MRHTLPWWVEGLVALVAVSCGAAYSYLRLPAAERRLFEIYSVSLTTAQQAEYLSRGERDAVFGQSLMAGMSADALFMSWGDPWYRVRLGEDAEEWV